MATDPVRRIRSRDYTSPLDTDLEDVLHDLASLPMTPETPYLTVTLDWTPSGESPGRRPPEERRRSEMRNAPAEDTTQRPALTWFNAEASSLLNEVDERAPERPHLEADIARITEWLEHELDTSAGGAVVVSSQGQDLFVPLALGVPVPNEVSYRPLPSVDVLAHVVEDYETYAVLVCNQEEAELTFVTQATREGGIFLESSLYPRKQSSGGWSQRRYQARAGERVSAFARTIADEVTQALRETGVRVLVLVGSATFMHALEPEFPDDIRERIAGSVPMDFHQHPGQDAIVEVTTGLALEAERAREADSVASVLDLLGGGRAVGGTIDVINALGAGQVQKLVMNEDFAERGWADFAFPVLGQGAIPDEHPLGGNIDDLVEVGLHEEFVRFTLQQGGDVEMVHTQVPVTDQTSGSQEAGSIPRSEPAARLDELGGVAALLRFAQ